MRARRAPGRSDAPPRRVVAVAALLALVFLGGATPSRAPARKPARSVVKPAAHALQTAEIYLTWNDAHGRPRAATQLTPSCADTGRVDTLFLSFDPGQLRPTVIQMDAVLYFYPPPGDTLQEFWFFKRGWPNEGNLIVYFEDVVGAVCEPPWTVMGKGSVAYDHRSGRGRLDLSYQVPASDGMTIYGGTTYCLARVLIRHRRSDLAGCSQAVRIEWGEARIRYARTEKTWTQGERVVAWNDTSGHAARGLPLVRTWHPKFVPPPPPIRR